MFKSVTVLCKDRLPSQTLADLSGMYKGPCLAQGPFNMMQGAERQEGYFGEQTETGKRLKCSGNSKKRWKRLRA